LRRIDSRPRTVSFFTPGQFQGGRWVDGSAGPGLDLGFGPGGGGGGPGDGNGESGAGGGDRPGRQRQRRAPLVWKERSLPGLVGDVTARFFAPRLPVSPDSLPLPPPNPTTTPVRCVRSPGPAVMPS
jgi:hypothetical protein